MRTEEGKTLRIPGWERELRRKHREQMAAHELAFGPLGKKQTKAQKTALRRATNEMKGASK